MANDLLRASTSFDNDGAGILAPGVEEGRVDSSYV
jgi:hypothetical protein